MRMPRFPMRRTSCAVIHWGFSHGGCYCGMNREEGITMTRIGLARLRALALLGFGLFVANITFGISVPCRAADEPENVKRENGAAQADDVVPKVKLAKVPAIALQPRRPLTRENVKRIKGCIADLAKIDRPDVGLSGTMSGTAFLPVAGQQKSSAMILTDHRLESSPALRVLVELGPDALPFLLDTLADRTETKLVLEHRSGFGAMWLDNELWGNPVNELEMKVLGRRAGIPRNRLDPKPSLQKYTVRVGDVCLVAIGQIVGRGYEAVRYQPTACIVINSPTEDYQLRDQARMIWTSDHPDRKLLDSLLLDYCTQAVAEGRGLNNWYFGAELQTAAALRLLYYYPKETASLISRRLRSLDVRKPSPQATETEQEAWRRREVANGIRTDRFIEAVSWCAEPDVRRAIRDVFAMTSDVELLLAALPGIEDTDRVLIRTRLEAFVHAIPPDEGGGYGDSRLLDALAERLDEGAAPAFERFIQNATALRGYTAAGVLGRRRRRNAWCIDILGSLLKDRRPAGRDTYPVDPADHGKRLQIRVCDAAAEALCVHRPELKFSLKGDYDALDKQIQVIRAQLTVKLR